MSSILPDTDEQARAAREARTKEIYESKCTHPNADDILNGMCELRYEDALLIQKIWNKDDAVLGAAIRNRFKRDFLEASEILAMDELEGYGLEQGVTETELKQSKMNGMSDLLGQI